MNHSSEYHFPIFISSTDYNLIDLRAELANYLCSLGYRPILSSASGFPDKSPELEPWESCLPVLGTCFLVILIVDGRYGSPLEWPNYEKIFEKKKYSPTHGEYLFATTLKKRVLVFVRRELSTYYDSFRQIKKVKSLSTEGGLSQIKDFLPERVDARTLQMYSEIKTTRPIPWITEFDDVTDLKIKLQKKLLNELVQLFQLKEKRLDTVIQAFQQAMNGLSEEKQKEIISRFDYVTNVSKLEEELTRKQESIENLNKELEATKVDAKKAAELNDRINSLTKEMESIKKKSKTPNAPMPAQRNLLSDALTGNGFGVRSAADYTLSTKEIPGVTSMGNYVLSDKLSTASLDGMFILKKCDSCKNVLNDPLSSLRANGRTCRTCHRNLCENCWPSTASLNSYIECPDCARKPQNGLI